MSCIRILPDELANRIAAGEVIERPASVVKELVENALDAGAKRIVVKTKEGGRRLIQVGDDGCGMDRDDAMLCIEPHATSKVRTAADIERISTLGFRGEALPSIAAVSRFQLQTRTHGAVCGGEVLIEGGVLRDVRDCGCAPGTNVRVEQLFGNVPARRKFLQSAATEDGHIQETVLLHALAHPEVSIELFLDERQVLHARRTSDLGARIGMLLGRDVLSAMMPVEYEEAGIRVTGFVARPGVTRSSRREQRIIVNGRPASADTVYFAVRDAYHTMVMKGRYPPVVLYVAVAAERVDVNVHPSKREVRFRESRLVARVVTAAVGRALRELAGELSADIQPSLVPPRGQAPSAFEFGTVPEQQRLPLERPATTVPPESGAAGAPAPPAPLGQRPEEAERPPPQAASGGPSPSAATREEIRSLQVLGVLNQLYLVAKGSQGLVLVDQHAAHERVLFEQLLRTARESGSGRQQLLLPVTVDLSPSDTALLEQHLASLQGVGFGLEPFGGNTYLVSAVPSSFPQENVAGLLRDILDDLRQGMDARSTSDDVRIAQAACKHAVKASDVLGPEEVSQLLADLARAEMPYTCPHGRPVMINVSYAELGKRFGRQG